MTTIWVDYNDLTVLPNPGNYGFVEGKHLLNYGRTIGYVGEPWRTTGLLPSDNNIHGNFSGSYILAKFWHHASSENGLGHFYFVL